MTAFVTGSRAYGTPRPDSDVDLVVPIDAAALRELLDVVNEDEVSSGSGYHGVSLRFGRLNLICVTGPRQLDAWSSGTKALKAKAPVARDEAVALFKSLLDAWSSGTKAGASS